MTRYPVSGDRRYTVDKEFCGHATARFVLRFCGEFVASSTSYASMVVRAVGHKCSDGGKNVVAAV